jgi:hypothetical protein
VPISRNRTIDALTSETGSGGSNQEAGLTVDMLKSGTLMVGMIVRLK